MSTKKRDLAKWRRKAEREQVRIADAIAHNIMVVQTRPPDNKEVVKQ
jgi:hypothetical protein